MKIVNILVAGKKKNLAAAIRPQYSCFFTLNIYTTIITYHTARITAIMLLLSSRKNKAGELVLQNFVEFFCVLKMLRIISSNNLDAATHPKTKLINITTSPRFSMST